ncbi:dihydrodipicolinate synthase family protein [Anaerosporomusa subterranea]|uniref:Dihydrodipicolinate synthase family protein n=1 Tax=Anaerosporomusa subterranea TaxID=1794912 RepID=A0A154BS62_ANASB|nr:dihydrodipicolinate synthase family protein [Anaerosporomusa subterranea]KYZ76660.1 dihydrodipicolinate synthase family protein [Anaerosporomusa subterranea]
MKYLYGLTTAMITPFSKDGTVDLDKMKNLTNFLIEKGTHCLYPLGTTGEGFRLSVEERKQVAQTVVETANHRVRVYIHVGAVNQEDTIELAKHAHSIGAEGIGCVTPFFLGVNDREMEEYFVKVASSVPDDFPVYLYNIPQCAANDLKVEVVQKIANRCPNVVGVKYSYADLFRTSEYLTINQGTASVVSGVDRLFLAALAMGCHGTVSGVACVYPEPFVAIYDAFKVGDLEKARQLQTLTNKYILTLKSGCNMSYFKEGLKLRGIDVGYMKAPQLDLTDEEINELKRQLTEIDREARAMGL